jgi:hypothetical protein
MPFGYYKPPSAAGASKAKPTAPAAPKPAAADRSSTPAVERPIGDYDPRRAKRQMSRPIFGGRR